MNKHINPVLLLCLPALMLFVAPRTSAADEIPLEAWGALPAISSMALSPSGTRIAYRQTYDGRDVLIMRDLEDKSLLSVLDVSTTNPRYVFFIDDDHVVLFASETAKRFGVRDGFRMSGAYVYELSSNKSRVLLNGSTKVYPLQEGLGRIVGHNANARSVYMPAYLAKGNRAKPRYGLFEVSLQRDRVSILRKGTRDTIDWFVDSDGRVLLEEEMDNEDDIHRLWAYRNDNRELLLEMETERPLYEPIGLTPDRSAAVYRETNLETGFDSYFGMRLADGEREGPMFEKDDASVAHALVGLNRVVQGVEYSGFLPRYEFFDQTLNQRVRELQQSAGGAAAYLIDWTPDFNHLLFRVSGGWTAGAFAIAHRDEPTLTFISSMRPDIPEEAVASTLITEYEARDGLIIPALITARADVHNAGNAPLIVLPHGGPESYDRFGFDWLTQYFASRGYVVLQPQFRGSSGFGAAHVFSGRGEWGSKMSTDLDDGVKHLIDKGFADPERVCMVGASYGGYAALAAGAFSPFEYKCLVAIAGVSDLSRMMYDSRRRHGRDHWVIAYWQDQFGSEEAGRAALKEISPVRFADAFRAPVLLVHGRDDLVVPLRQSSAMYSALRRADKSVEFVKLKGEDHYLSKGETRTEALRAVAEFVETHL